MLNKKVSVLLSTYNAKERLVYALASYMNQTYPKELYEVIVIDDGSTDGTHQLIKRVKPNYKLKYIQLPNNLGRAAARNRAIREASGEILIFSDCDMIAEKDFIAKHAAHHAREDKIFVCGSFWNRIYTYAYRTKDKRFLYRLKRFCQTNKYMAKRYRTRLNRLNKSESVSLIPLTEIKNEQYLHYVSKQPFWSRYFDQYIQLYGKNLYSLKFPWFFFIVMNVSVKRKHLERIGLFDENMQGYGGEDIDMGIRLYQAGIRPKVDPEIRNFHQEHPRNWKKQLLEKRRNTRYLIEKHKRIDVLMRYAVPGKQTYKNQVLLEIDSTIEKGIVSESFKNDCTSLLYTYYQHRNSKSKNSPKTSLKDKISSQFILDLKALRKSRKKLILDFFIKLLKEMNLSEDQVMKLF